jgi:hypothetical protein
MFPCTDPVLTYLNELGYNVVRLPRSGIVPLEVIGKRGRENPETLGQIETIWKSETAKPTPAEDTATSVNGGITKSLKLSIGIKLLENILPALGAGTASVGATYQNASTLKFRFGKPKVLKIDALIVGEYLRSGDIDLQNSLTKYFLKKDYYAYIITEVLQSNSISVIAEDKLGNGIDVAIPAVGGAAKGGVTIEKSTATKGALTYKGKEFLTFGYKAFQIAVVDGRWDLERVRSTGSNALLAPADEAKARETLKDAVVEEELSML